MPQPLTAADLVAEARALIREVEPRDFAARPDGAIVIDVREPAEFDTGHIPGAVNIPVSGLFAGADTAYPGGMPSEQVLRERLAPVLAAVTAGEPIGVYCGSGVSAAQAVLALASLGVQVPLYAGSWSAWSNDPARPVATGA